MYKKREEVNLVWSTPFLHNLKAMHAHKSYDEMSYGKELSLMRYKLLLWEELLTYFPSSESE
jgi:hypothetical protein